jgi:hypothetical protein
MRYTSFHEANDCVLTSRVLKKASCRLLKKIQRRAKNRRAEAYLQYVVARRLSGNEAYGSFSAAC